MLGVVEVEGRLRVGEAGHAEDEEVDALGGELRGGRSVGVERGDRPDDSVGVRAAELDVLAVPDLSREIARRTRRNRAPRSSPSTNGRVRDRLEEDRPVARAAVALELGLTHEAGVQQGLERQGDGRLRDACSAGDLGPRDGRPEPDRLQHGSLVEILEQRRRLHAP